MTKDALGQVEQRMLRLMGILEDRLSPEDYNQVSTLIESKEFGVGLEWIIDSLTETHTPLPKEAMPLVIECARLMGMFPEVLQRLPVSLIEPESDDERDPLLDSI